MKATEQFLAEIESLSQTRKQEILSAPDRMENSGTT